MPGQHRPERFRGVRAITLDLDDTLWPVSPVLAGAEACLTDWLRPLAPKTAELVPMGAKLPALKARYPERAHDVSWLRLQYLRQTLTEHGEDPALAEPAFERFYQARQLVQPYAEVEAVLEHWAQHYRLGAITNGNADVRRTPLGRHFSVVLSAHEFGAAKPDPSIFLAACQALEVSPAETLHIGDDWAFDVEPAQLLGMQVAWLRRSELPTPQICSLNSEKGFSSVVFQDLWSIDHVLKPMG